MTKENKAGFCGVGILCASMLGESEGAALYVVVAIIVVLLGLALRYTR